MNLTESQAKLLSDIQRMPKRSRTPSGLVKYSAVEHYDWRSLSGLFTKGYLEHSESGIRVAEEIK
jgi:hypothetical protein